MKIYMINKKSIASAIAAGSLLFNAFATTAYATNSVTISGNGADSDNTVNLSSNRTNTVVQSNQATFTNSVSSSSNTGGNVADNNTGGDVVIATGNSVQEVAIANRANENKAFINDCNCLSGGTDVKVSGNGAGSDNDANVANNNENNIFQDNSALFVNDVHTYGNTGKNYANNNTGSPYGGSDVLILTGNATSDVAIANAANRNWAHVGGTGAGQGGGSSVEISGNGADSYNSVNLANNRVNSLVQANDALFVNNVDQKLNTGKNYANNNTGGEVTIDTGAALAQTLIDNRANFNVAHLDCGCVTGGIDAKISGNGYESDSDINAALNDTDTAFQDNLGDFFNDVYGYTKSGYNGANNNTGPVGSDPAIFTGNAGSDTAVSNQANMNVYGSSLSLGGLSLNFGWDWNGLWGMAGL